MNDLIFKAANVIHRTVLSLSGGRLGVDVLNMPVLELTTTGAKSGQKRTAMLTAPVQEGDTIVIVASRGGDSQHPGWFHNLKANPAVEVSLRGGRKRPMRARVADADERARLWPLVTKRYRGYEQYQQRTMREIPLVLLEPVTD